MPFPMHQTNLEDVQIFKSKCFTPTNLCDIKYQRFNTKFSRGSQTKNLVLVDTANHIFGLKVISEGNGMLNPTKDVFDCGKRNTRRY